MHDHNLKKKEMLHVYDLCAYDGISYPNENLL